VSCPFDEGFGEGNRFGHEIDVLGNRGFVRPLTKYYFIISKLFGTSVNNEPFYISTSFGCDLSVAGCPLFDTWVTVG
jgi:hypothetical protein